VHRTLLAAAISPDNTPHGYNLTFAIPLLMFIITAVALYLRFRSPHQVPGHVALTSARWANPESAQQEAHPETLEADGTQTTAGSSLQESAADPEAPPESVEDS
jgi:hypothetical protein